MVRANQRLKTTVLLIVALAWSTSKRAQAITVTLTDADPASSAIMHVGDRLRVELAAAPANGFRWEAHTLDASHLERMARDLRPESNRLDTAGTQVFVWKAISPGHAEIALAYGRPSDERTSSPARRVLISVDVLAGALDPPLPADGDPLAAALRPVATYQGKLPCGDCLEATIDITFYAPGRDPEDPARAASGQSAADAGVPDQQAPTPTVFLQSIRYTGAPEGSRRQISTGQVKVLHGTYADPSAIVYVLDSPEGGSYRLNADQLTLLDAQMLPSKSPQGAPVLLDRQPRPTTSPASQP